MTTLNQRKPVIIDCDPGITSITSALLKLFSGEFQASLKDVVNPHGTGNVSGNIVSVLRHHSLSNIVKKSFYDLPNEDKLE